MCMQVPQMVCTTCGKPCRSEAERALHIKYTGHTEFVDKVRQAGSTDNSWSNKAGELMLPPL